MAPGTTKLSRPDRDRRPGVDDHVPLGPLVKHLLAAVDRATVDGVDAHGVDLGLVVAAVRLAFLGLLAKTEMIVAHVKGFISL